MRSEGLVIASINHHLGGIRPFIYWCMEDIRRYVTYFRIRLVNRGQDEIPKHYEIKDVLKLLKKPDKKATFVEWRNWAVVSFIMGTSARVGTIVSVRMKDIDFEEGTVFYQHTKNKRLQTANMPPQLIVDLTNYIKMWRIEDNDGYQISEDDY